MKEFLIFLCLSVTVHSFVLPLQVLSAGLVTQAADVVDTMGAVVWTTDTFCNIRSNISTPHCYGKHRFDLWNSSTYNEGFAFNNEDHLGFLEGMYGYHRISLGNIENQTTTAHIRWIQAEDAIPIPIAYTPGIDGVLGLGGSTGTHAYVMDQFYAMGAWSKNVVTLCLENYGETSDNGSEGAIYYGDYDPLHCKYSYSVPSTDSNIYQFTTTRFQMTINGTVVVTSGSSRQAVLDSASPYFSAPSVVVLQILSALGFNASVTAPTEIDCSYAATVNMTLSTAKGEQVIQGVNLIIPHSNGKCWLALAEASFIASANFNVHYELGAPFFRGRCTYLDRGHQTIGFGFPGKRVPQMNSTNLA